jgi:hypothetical protein
MTSIHGNTSIVAANANGRISSDLAICCRACAVRALQKRSAAWAPPSLCSRTAGPEFDKAPKRFSGRCVSFLFRLRQPRNNCSKFIEHLLPALQLTALHCVLHGFISNEGEFRLAVSKILKQNHVARTFYSLMFCS